MTALSFNVAQLMKERIGATRDYTIQSEIENLDPEIVALDELNGHLRLLRTVDGVLVTGLLTVTLGLVCDRCLEPFVVPVEIELEDEFRPSLDMVSGASLPVPHDADANIIDDHHILDLQ